MTYASGSLIVPSDYNNFVGSNPSSTINAINTVWATGSGSAGYGQTPLSQAAASAGLVTATQWASLINTLNSILTHQSGSGSGIGAVTSGQTISYLSTLSSSITTAYNNRLTFATNAAAVVGTSFTSPFTNVSTAAPANTAAFGTRASFTSGDAARYFFNSGGRLKFSCSGTVVTATSRSNEIAFLLANLGGVALFGANTNGGRLGTKNDTENANVLTVGYHTASHNANTLIVAITSVQTSYTSDTANITANVNGTIGSNNDNGKNVDFWINVTTGTGSSGGTQLTDNYSVNVIRSIDVSYPETTNLSNTWGAVTITQLN
jgi:hypothetical protein